MPEKYFVSRPSLYIEIPSTKRVFNRPIDRQKTSSIVIDSFWQNSIMWTFQGDEFSMHSPYNETNDLHLSTFGRFLGS